MVSQAYGAGEHEPIERSVRQGFWLALCLAVPAIILLSNIAPILLWAGQPPSAVAAAQGYLRAAVWGILPFLWYMTLRVFVEGISRPLPVTAIAGVGVFLNIFANYTLMFGKFGFPALGLVGTGYATALTYWFMMIGLATYCRTASPTRRDRIFSTVGRPDPHYFKEIFRIGWPIGVSIGIESGLFMLTALMIGSTGTTELAADPVALQCAASTLMVPLGVGRAAAVRVAQAIGRRDLEGARRAGVVAIGLATLFMTGPATLFWTLPRVITGFFLDLSNPANDLVAEMAVTLLGIAAAFQIFDGIQVTAAGSLRGLKDTRVPMIIGFVHMWMYGLASGITMCFRIGWGAVGLWYGLVLGLIAASILLTRRFGKMTSSLERATAVQGVV